jgi:phosphoribosylformylglycinamidine cyclo-ligase
VRALAHVTGDGLFNLVRTTKPVGFDIEHWPEPRPIFGLLQRLGGIADEEMFRAFNMGIGFGLVVGARDADAARRRLEAAGERVHVLGRATLDAARTIQFRPRGLIGRDGRFTRA